MGALAVSYRPRTFDDHYEAKHQCGVRNGVIFLKSSELNDVFEYVNTTYGKDYLHKFKIYKEV